MQAVLYNGREMVVVVVVFAIYVLTSIVLSVWMSCQPLTFVVTYVRSENGQTF